MTKSSMGRTRCASSEGCGIPSGKPVYATSRLSGDQSRLTVSPAGTLGDAPDRARFHVDDVDSGPIRPAVCWRQLLHDCERDLFAVRRPAEIGVGAELAEAHGAARGMDPAATFEQEPFLLDGLDRAVVRG